MLLKHTHKQLIEYCAFTRSLSCEWSYIHRVSKSHEAEYAPLHNIIRQQFTPAGLGREVLEREHQLLALPAKFGGLAITDPTETAPGAHAVSKDATRTLARSICSCQPVVVNDHSRRISRHCKLATSQASRIRDEQAGTLSKELLQDLPKTDRRTLSRIVEGHASGWLTVLPLRQESYDMSATQFRDQLAIRYGRQPNSLPFHCDGCGALFTLQHGLDCHKGGLVKRGHNDLRDSDAKLADIAFGGVTIEPILIPEQDRNGRPMLQADWLVRGVWEGNRVAFFDNRIVDADAPSYAKANLSWNATANKAAAAKNRKYKHAAEELRGSFTPLVCSTDAVLHSEYSAYQKRLASRLAAKWEWKWKWEKSFSAMMAWVLVRTQFSFSAPWTCVCEAPVAVFWDSPYMTVPALESVTESFQVLVLFFWVSALSVALPSITFFLPFFQFLLQ